MKIYEIKERDCYRAITCAYAANKEVVKDYILAALDNNIEFVGHYDHNNNLCGDWYSNLSKPEKFPGFVEGLRYQGKNHSKLLYFYEIDVLE
jgi:hypothetical protein